MEFIIPEIGIVSINNVISGRMIEEPMCQVMVCRFLESKFKIKIIRYMLFLYTKSLNIEKSRKINIMKTI